MWRGVGAHDAYRRVGALWFSVLRDADLRFGVGIGLGLRDEVLGSAIEIRGYDVGIKFWDWVWRRSEFWRHWEFRAAWR